jgi:hypothetical protein
MSDQAGGQKIGALAGTAGGAALGSYLGPVGTVVGGGIGGYLGSAIGGGIGSLFGGGSNASQMSAQQAQALADEQALRDRLTAVATGQAPSVAGLQLGAGLDRIVQNANAQAAGATGEGGVLARYGAMQAAATAGAQTNQQAAIARAQEIANANQELGSLVGSTLGTTTTGSNAANKLQLDQANSTIDQGQKLLGGALQGATNRWAFNSSSAPAAAAPAATGSAAPGLSTPSASGGVPQITDDELAA